MTREPQEIMMTTTWKYKNKTKKEGGKIISAFFLCPSLFPPFIHQPIIKRQQHYTPIIKTYIFFVYPLKSNIIFNMKEEEKTL